MIAQETVGDNGPMGSRRRSGRKQRRSVPAPAAYVSARPGTPKIGSTNCAATCPIPLAHKRLRDCHDYWHKMHEVYHDPHGFRRELNTLLQSLRNVTFILQAEKSAVPDFDAWYAPWQERMREHPVMRWSHQSRNHVVKQGDLETHSVATARLIASWSPRSSSDGESSGTEGVKAAGVDGQEPEIHAAPSSSAKEQVEQLLALPNAVIRDGFIEFRRRWVDKNLPDYELLDACAEVYGFLSLLFDDLHKRLGLETGYVFMHGGTPVVVQDHSSGRPPCMVVPELPVRRLRLSNGSVDVGGRRFAAQPGNIVEYRKVLKRYGQPPAAPPKVSNLVELTDWYMQLARQMMIRDRHHGWYAFLFKGTTQVAAEILEARDFADKSVVMRELADTMDRSDVDGIIVVGDSWLAPIEHDPDGIPIPARHSPKRTEALAVDVLVSTGESRGLIWPYERRWGKVVFVGEPIEANGRDGYLTPVREMWQRKQSSDKTS